MQQTMLPASPKSHRAAGWTRQTRMESLLLMKLFPLLHSQLEQSASCIPAYCSDRRLTSRVCRIRWVIFGAIFHCSLCVSAVAASLSRGVGSVFCLALRQSAVATSRIASHGVFLDYSSYAIFISSCSGLAQSRR